MSEIDPSAPGPDHLPRPAPDRAVGERWSAWLAWFGFGRLVVTALCVVVVALGVFWLVRAPAPPAEATLPRASAATTDVPTSTLPPPTTAPSDDTDDRVPDGPIVVHVAGEVAAPGVYELEPDGRVNDAVARAGGPTADAELDVLNLAQPLLDGMRLYVPAVDDAATGEIEPITPPVAAEPAGAGDPDAPAGPVDVNRAPPAELEILPGVGPSTAQAIVDDRERNGPFATVDELERVPGIGPAKLAAIRDLVIV